LFGGFVFFQITLHREPEESPQAAADRHIVSFYSISQGGKRKKEKRKGRKGKKPPRLPSPPALPISHVGLHN
jgi:hypothetical protein